MAELLRLMQTLIIKFDDLDVKVDGLNVKFDGLAADMKEVKSDVKKLGTRMGRVEGKVDLLGGQFRDVAHVVIEDTQRITSVEQRVSLLESESH